MCTGRAQLSNNHPICTTRRRLDKSAMRPLSLLDDALGAREGTAAVSLPVDVRALVLRTICEASLTLALDNPVLEGAVVDCACLPSEGSLAVLSVEAPLCEGGSRMHTLQGEASRRRRFSDWCRLDSRLLTTVVNGTIGKCQYTVSVAYAVLVLACVDGSIGIDLVAKA